MLEKKENNLLVMDELPKIRPLSDEEKERVAKIFAMWDDHSGVEVLRWAADKLSSMGSIEPLTEEEKDRIAELVEGGLTESKPQCSEWFGEYID